MNLSPEIYELFKLSCLLFDPIKRFCIFTRYVSDITDPTVRRKPAMSRLKQQQQRLFDSDQTIPEVPSVITQNTKVRNNIQRLRDSQDEIFEL